MKQQRFIYLINQYVGKTISAEEITELQALLNEMERSELPQTLSDVWLTEIISMPRQPMDVGEADRQADVILALDKDFDSGKVTNVPYDVQPGISGTDDHVSPAHRVHFLRRGWFRYAAAVILLFGVGAYLWMINKNDQALAEGNKQPKAKVVPGKDGAILTLADGTQVVLDSLGTGIVATQNGVEVVLKDGLLAYNATGNSSVTVSYNTMTTPKGRQFQLVLPDGSKVWLNAASSIKYPTVFAEADRMVEINGEAYFEVEKNKSKPFKVKINDATVIEVLGTSFNINSYENEEAMKTTLLEGSVRVSAYKHLQTLKPGQQAQVYSNEIIKVVSDIDINQIMAWKNGYFDFNKADLQVMMRQLERWYDITVTYEGKIPKMVFKGKMDRNVPLSDVARFLTASGIKTSLQGRNLIISGS